MTFRWFLPALLLAGVVGLGGCGGVDTTDSVICDPVACEGNPNYVVPSTPAPASSGPDDWWWNVAPCTLLTAGELRGLGLPAGPAQATTDWAPAGSSVPESDCGWGLGTNSVGVGLAAAPYTEITGGTVDAAGESSFRTADGRPGLVYPDSDTAGACLVMFQATEGSSASVVLADPGPGMQACRVVMKLANLIAPQLPRTR
jgi:hypothetical protein